MRCTIARRTAESASTIPHFHLKTELDATELLRHSRELRATSGTRVTITDYLLLALARALRRCPSANGVWRDDSVRLLPTVDVGLVVAVDGGLLVPVVREADRLDLVRLSEVRADLIATARSGRASAEMMSGGSASLTNLGAGAVDEFQPVILPHQSSMLAVGRILPRPFVVDGELCVRPTLRLCLSIDHRVLDGVPGAEYLSHVIDFLENPLNGDDEECD